LILLFVVFIYRINEFFAWMFIWCVYLRHGKGIVGRNQVSRSLWRKVLLAVGWWLLPLVGLCNVEPPIYEALYQSNNHHRSSIQNHSKKNNLYLGHILILEPFLDLQFLIHVKPERFSLINNLVFNIYLL